MQTKSKYGTTQMKALGEYILMVLFVLLLKRVYFIVYHHASESFQWEHCYGFIFLQYNESLLSKWKQQWERSCGLLTEVAWTRPLGPISFKYAQEMGKIALEP